VDDSLLSFDLFDMGDILYLNDWVLLRLGVDTVMLFESLLMLLLLLLFIVTVVSTSFIDWYLAILRVYIFFVSIRNKVIFLPKYFC
jgi:hypothetical protein